MNYKKLIPFLILIFTIELQLFAQQSRSMPFRPIGVSIGDTLTNKKIQQVIINGVPSYLWHRGCGPTALGMVIGYYDSNGFPDLIQGTSSTQTSQVNQVIASDAHYNNYSLPLDYSPNLISDKSSLGGAHVSNSLADFMRTSWSSASNYWGWSWTNDIGNSFISYIQYINSNYSTLKSHVHISNTTAWDQFKIEIDQNRPVVFLVDSNGNGGSDHFVTGIGYDNSNQKYAIYDTWDHNIHWYEFRPMSNTYSWGIYGFTKLQITNTLHVSEFNNQIKIYPNPTNDLINIDGIENFKDYSIKIYDIFGKLIQVYYTSEIDISSYNSGLYFLHLIFEENVLQTQIFKN